MRTRFSFVSPASALDIADFIPPALSAKYINNVASFSSTSTNGFIAQEQTNLFGGTDFNVPHLTFTARNGEWMYDVMENKPFASSYCSTECNPLAITSTLPAGQRLCAGQSATFSIPNAPASTIITWSATPASFFTVTSGSGPTFTTAAANAAGGTGTVTVTIGPCNTQLSVSVPVGPGEPAGRYAVGAYFSDSGTPLQTNNPAGPDKVNIIVDAPYDFTFTTTAAVSVTKTGNNSASFYMPTSTGVAITATATNATSGCGVVGHWNFIPAPFRMMVTPNPASTELTVTPATANQPGAAPTSLQANAQLAKAEELFTADLYDMYGKKVKTKKSEQGKAVFDVRDLPTGLYNLRVGEGQNAFSDHIQITR